MILTKFLTLGLLESRQKYLKKQIDTLKNGDRIILTAPKAPL